MSSTSIHARGATPPRDEASPELSERDAWAALGRAALTTTRDPRDKARLRAWLDAGLYGRCTVCSAMIERDRLLDDPTIPTCATCCSRPKDPRWLLF